MSTVYDQPPLESSPTNEDSDAGSVGLLYFRSGSLRMCIELEYVSQVFYLIALQPLPGAPDYVQGLMNFHGRMAPAIDLCRRLGIANSRQYSIDTPMMFCQYLDKAGGLIVSEIHGLLTLPASTLQMSELLHETGAPFSAAIQLRDGPAVLLNPGAILDLHTAVSPAALPDKIRNTGAELHTDGT